MMQTEATQPPVLKQEQSLDSVNPVIVYLRKDVNKPNADNKETFGFLRLGESPSEFTYERVTLQDRVKAIINVNMVEIELGNKNLNDAFGYMLSRCFVFDKEFPLLTKPVDDYFEQITLSKELSLRIHKHNFVVKLKKYLTDNLNNYLNLREHKGCAFKDIVDTMFLKPSGVNPNDYRTDAFNLAVAAGTGETIETINNPDSALAYRKALADYFNVEEEFLVRMNRIFWMLNAE